MSIPASPCSNNIWSWFSATPSFPLPTPPPSSPPSSWQPWLWPAPAPPALPGPGQLLQPLQLPSHHPHGVSCSPAMRSFHTSYATNNIHDPHQCLQLLCLPVTWVHLQQLICFLHLALPLDLLRIMAVTCVIVLRKAMFTYWNCIFLYFSHCTNAVV